MEEEEGKEEEKERVRGREMFPMAIKPLELN